MLPPMTIVLMASTMELAGLPLKSMLTNGSSQNSRMPFRGPPAAFFNALLTSSTVTSLSRSATRSTTDTVEVGIRNARP